MIRFGLYTVNNGTHKARVQYSLDGHISGRSCVTVRCKDYGHALEKIFRETTNNSDGMTDYFETSKVRLFPEHPLYPAARQAAEKIKAKRVW